MKTGLAAYPDLSLYVAEGWQNPWTKEPAAALILLSIPLALTVVFLVALRSANPKYSGHWTWTLLLVPPLFFAGWAAIAVGQGHRALVNELMVAGGMATGWLVMASLAVLLPRSRNIVLTASLLFLAAPFITLGSAFAVRETALTLLNHRIHALARERDLVEFQARERALEACVKNYGAQAGRRDAARALAAGDPRSLYRIVHYQEGATIYVPGLEIAGGSEEGWSPPDHVGQVLGWFAHDQRWYWVNVRETTTNAPWPDPWGWVGQLSGQQSKYLGKCERAESEYLKAYNASIPPGRLRRRPAPPPSADVMNGAPMVAASN